MPRFAQIAKSNKMIGAAAALVGLVLILALLIALTNPLGERAAVPAPPNAAGGVLDLTGWDFEADGIVTLAGEWEFYWNRLLEASDFAGDESPRGRTFVQVPNVWTNYHDETGIPYPGFGYATYRLKVIAPAAPQRLALKIPDLSTACRIIADGRVIAECGVVSDNPDEAVARYTPGTVLFPVDSGEFDLIVQVSNYLYDRGGMWYALHLGTEEAIARYRENIIAVDLTLFGVFLFTGLYHVAVYLLRRTEKIALYFALGCFIGAVRLLVTGEIYLLNLLPHMPVEGVIALIYFTYYGGVMVLTLYLRKLYPQIIHRGVPVAVAAISGVFLASVCFFPVSVYTHMIRYYHIVTMLLGIYFVAAVAVAAWKRIDGARLQLVGIGIFVLAIFHDILFNLFYISRFVSNMSTVATINKQIVLFGLFALVLTQAVVLAQRFSKAFHAVESLSERLLSLDKLKDEFLVNTSHELKTPLHGVMNLSQSLADGSSGPLNAAQKQSLATIVTVARRLNKLIDDILDLAKLKHDAVILYPRPVSVAALLKANEDMFRSFAGNKPIEFVTRVPDDLPPV